ncbi:integrin-linked protein kinase homolog pat-4-like [Haliotis rubra]|uniref:integrin-linked protein kinase homolog pat-4-like n=1 Tax=Haliotis rubra TaxID=36100 RepID=UPI001EE53847|nr:integrin-linked protein kinase homolog pat-4-like [Haliotis rubra]
MAARWRHRDVVEFLVNEGADLSLVDQFHNNVLHGACIGGDVQIVSYLLSRDVLDINSKGHNGKTSLMLAAIHKHSGVVDLLLLEGADMSPVDNSGNNVLHCACLGGNVMVVQHLLSRGRAGIYARNKGGKTAADLARDKGFGRINDLLASFGVYK